MKQTLFTVDTCRLQSLFCLTFNLLFGWGQVLAEAGGHPPIFRSQEWVRFKLGTPSASAFRQAWWACLVG